MHIFTSEDWKNLSEDLNSAGGRIDERFSGIALSDIEFHLWIPSGNSGRIGRILSYLDLSFRWSLSIANEISSGREWHSEPSGTLHPFPLFSAGGGLRLETSEAGSFRAKLKAANDVAVQCLAVPSLVVTLFVGLTGIELLAPDSTTPPAPPACERVVSQLGGSERWLRPFREASPGGYTMRAICVQENGEGFYFEWGMERRMTAGDSSHVHDVQVLMFRDLSQRPDQ
ncbi:hypothetical protein [Streptomyces showdoensis]|uniref:Uncharacterized protein n=1 Tax=Streptomyces showdoensis TaxID=68268 RepID=A0A2P2GTR8_STREW|nr:hypothetical protein [Streptomyces showdoensis]KKZ74894.1 hypothetical protein VO63_05465 [Streptomyces showdoensis]